jgi:thiamine-phosphate pyrophosphorylase
MTDPRMGEALWSALERLPRGAGVVVRHYDSSDRDALIVRIAKIARRRGLVMVVAHGRGRQHVHNARRGWGGGLQTAAAHSQRDAIAAIRRGADAVFVSPVFATRSHPGARALGRVRFGLVSRGLGVPVIALGGMDARRAKSLPGAYGWAGIDAWTV